MPCVLSTEQGQVSMSYEVEVKFAVDDPQALGERLEALGAKPCGEKRQTDQYFNHPARDFAQTDEAFRIRQDGDRILLTYKGPKIDRTTKTRREIEVPIGERPAVRQDLTEALVLLGFRPVLEVSKRRRWFLLEWRGYDIHVAIDHVDGLGTFVELEAFAEQATLGTTREAILSLAGELGLENGERRSYLQLLLDRTA